MIWRCPTKEAVLSIFSDAGRSLEGDILQALHEESAELKNRGLSQAFVIIDAQCRVCNHKQLIIVPEVGDLDNLECMNCECMSMQEREIPEWEDSG